jgi:hypothetical protein
MRKDLHYHALPIAVLAIGLFVASTALVMSLGIGSSGYRQPVSLAESAHALLTSPLRVNAPGKGLVSLDFSGSKTGSNAQDISVAQSALSLSR